MPQNFKQLELSINPGAPATAVPRSWFLFVNNVLKYLRVSNGNIIAYGDKWTIETKSARWSGRVFFGGELMSVPNITVDQDGVVDFSAWENTHVKINLRTGEVTGDDWDEQDTGDLNEYEYYSVATKSQDQNGNDVYTLNSNTVGDIHCRIT